MTDKIVLDDCVISPDTQTFIIAEIGINHGGSLDTAKKLVEQAALSGASAVKFQTYITEKRVEKDAPIFDILKQCEIGYKDQETLFKWASNLGLVVFSTPFDDESVRFLSDIDVDLFKVASFDVVNTPLLKAIAATKKPVIMSRGMANEKELDVAFNIFKDDNIPVVVLHCVSAYPLQDISSLNLVTMNTIKERYGCLTGFSDHTIGPDASICAVAMGACVIEKHFTLDKNAEGPDHAMSADPVEMKTMIDGIRNVELMKGTPTRGPMVVEQDILQYRRTR